MRGADRAPGVRAYEAPKALKAHTTVPPADRAAFRLEHSNLSEQHAHGGDNHRYAERESRVHGEEFHSQFHESPLYYTAGANGARCAAGMRPRQNTQPHPRGETRRKSPGLIPYMTGMWKVIERRLRMIVCSACVL